MYESYTKKKQEKDDMITLTLAVGGVIPIWLIALLCGRLFFKDIETSKKINYSTLTSYVICSILSGFGRMDGGGIAAFNPIIEYILSAIFVIAIRQLIFKLRGK